MARGAIQDAGFGGVEIWLSIYIMMRAELISECCFMRLILREKVIPYICGVVQVALEISSMTKTTRMMLQQREASFSNLEKCDCKQLWYQKEDTMILFGNVYFLRTKVLLAIQVNSEQGFVDQFTLYPSPAKWPISSLRYEIGTISSLSCTDFTEILKRLEIPWRDITDCQVSMRGGRFSERRNELWTSFWTILDCLDFLWFQFVDCGEMLKAICRCGLNN